MTAVTTPVAERGRSDAPEVAGFSPATVAAIVYREWLVFRRVWMSTAFGSLVEPAIYFVAFGYGFGALVAEVAGLSYLDFLATGAVAIGILFSSAFPALINGYFRRKESHLYDGILAAPVSVAELVTGESLWNGFRVAVVSVLTFLVAFPFGVRPGPGALLTPVVAVIAGFGFSCAGAAFASLLKSTHGFDFVIVGVIVPMYVVAGTFFPIEGLPAAGIVIARANPLYHVVELLRGLAFGFPSAGGAVVNLVVVLAFDLVAWWVAVRLVRRALID